MDFKLLHDQKSSWHNFNGRGTLVTFYLVIWYVKEPSHCLNESYRRSHPFLVLDVRGKMVHLFPLSMMLALSFALVVIWIKKFVFTDVELFRYFFYIYLDTIFFFSLSLWWLPLTEFQMLIQPGTSEIKPTCCCCCC